MFKKFILLYSLLFLFGRLSTSLFAENEVKKGNLTGIVTDAETHQPLPGCTVYFPDLKTGAVTDVDGKYAISNVPEGKFLVQVSFIGYQTFTEAVVLSDQSQHNFVLKTSAIEMSEVVVTGSAVSSDIRRSSVSVVALKGKDLQLSPSSNLVNLLTAVPGVSAVTTGGAVSKPVIRGLSSNHVVTLNEGIRQEGNQWGDEHGIEIDQFSVDRIEILKGPSSLFYGSDALGGVINVLEPVPAHQGHIHAEVSSQYSTNSKLSANSLMGEGNQHGLLWKLRGTYKSAASFQTPVEYVYNSGFNERNLSGLLGINRSWGFSHIHFSTYDANIGVIEAQRDPLTGKFVDSNLKIVSDNILMGRDIQLPFQEVNHRKLSMVNSFELKQWGQLKFNAGYQTNDRKEFSTSRDTAGLFFHLNTITYDLRYLLKEKNNWEPAFGFSGMTQQNQNKGNEYLIPDYNMQDWGGFAYLKKSFDKVTMNGGIRYDQRLIKGKQFILDSSGSADTVFRTIISTKTAFSGALGVTYQISNAVDMKINLGRGFRAPNIAELSANGPHEGTFRYEKGNADLNPETSMQVDGEISFRSRNVALVFSGFYNHIRNYIYQQKSNDPNKIVDGISYPVYQFVQGNSLLTGFELTADFHPVDNLHIENNFAFVYAENEDIHKPLPLIPPGKSDHSIRWVFNDGKGVFRSPFVKAGMNIVLKQGRIDSFETPTPGYVLFNTSLGSDIRVGKTRATFLMSGNNLFNKKYMDHLNRLKYVGILNPGRNITFGLNLPLEWVVEH